MSIPVIDLFAGPGGLGEGFSSYSKSGALPFDVMLSIEKDPVAHRTLKLRAFTRKFKSNIPAPYYEYVSTDKAVFSDYFPDALFGSQVQDAASEARNLTLGSDNAEIENLIKNRIGDRKDWVLIGGPPCQAYSLVGRSRMKGQDGFSCDERHTLYKHYLHMLAKFQPAVFVMENVKGILSSKIDGKHVFDMIRRDLSQPALAVNESNLSSIGYHIWSFTVPTDEPSQLQPSDFIVKSEQYGIPQKRHRVILLGIRADKDVGLGHDLILNPEQSMFSTDGAIRDMPKLRSQISRGGDDFDKWLEILDKVPQLVTGYDTEITSAANDVLTSLYKRRYEPKTGGRFVPKKVNGTRGMGRFIKDNLDWFHDEAIGGVLNHEARSHMETDLQRYLFCSIFAQHHGQSPKLIDFPELLLPAHKNVNKGRKGHFADRFRVQQKGLPATTITSHISKDGHYYIHYDPVQCRSLTVREAARLQTFPDNYFFEGNRTQQYHQVGNAVPPLLARKLADTVYCVMQDRGEI